MPPIIAVIGAGLVGLATTLKLRAALPSASLIVLEKEVHEGMHQSGNNSGVLHAGLYYKPGSAKARLAVQGIREMIAFCEEHRVAYEQCGKLVVAVNEAELPRLETLHERGTANGLVGLERLTPDAMRDIEPHVGGIAALRVPEEGIVDYPAVAKAMANTLAATGTRLMFGARVQRITRRGRQWILESTAGDVSADFLVGCAGLHADRIARLAGETTQARIVPFRGEYFELRPERRHLVRHLIYPVPDPVFPFLGVHFTRMIGGGVEAGPNAVIALAREGYRWSQVNVRDSLDALAFSGMWRFLSRHMKASAAEVHRSLSSREFAKSLTRLVPEITFNDLQRGGAGVRAQAMLPNGSLVEDFLFVEGPDALHVLNAPSPAATASLAIGGEIAKRVALRLTG